MRAVCLCITFTMERIAMSTVGIIAEYNPFHLGHEYHITEAKRLTGAEHAVVIMSGDFVQRGEPAICDKYLRTRMALASGADMVFELPVRYATASAEGFAEGAVSILSRLGFVDSLCFGAETDLKDEMMRLSKLLIDEPEEYRVILKERLRSGMSFPAAREQAVYEYTHDEGLSEILKTPNNILAVEYCKAVLRLRAKGDKNLHVPEPVPIKRVGAGYHDASTQKDELWSATGIREVLLDRKYAEYPYELLAKAVPSECNEILGNFYKKTFPVSADMFSDMLFMRLRTTAREELLACPEVTNDLLNTVLNDLGPSSSFVETVKRVKTKNLTYTGTSRALLHMMLGLGSEGDVSQVRLLGFRHSASGLLRSDGSERGIRIITKLADADREDPVLKEDLFAAECYARAVYTGYGMRMPSEFERQMIIR